MATLSSGDTQPVRTGWRSDNNSIATVSDQGLITAIGNGVVNISVALGVAQASQALRVVPDFQGQWHGRYVVLNCTETGFFATINTCSAQQDKALPTTLTFSQSGTSVSGDFLTGALTYTPISAQIESDGSIAFSGTSTRNVNLPITVSWRLTSQEKGKITGGHTQVWQDTFMGGEMRMETRIVDWLDRVATQPSSAQTTSILTSPREPGLGL